MIFRKLAIAAMMASATAAFAASNQDSSTVKQAQQALNSKGFNVGAADGVVGPKTQAALEKFQQSKGISGSGSLDSQTLAALGVSGDASASATTSSSVSPTQDTAPTQPSTSTNTSPATNQPSMSPSTNQPSISPSTNQPSASPATNQPPAAK